MRKQEINYSQESDLETLDLGLAVLSLEEAINTIKPGEESKPYQMTIREDPEEQPKNSARFKSN